jgi:capsular polysaccharide biosynthesis protein
MTEPPTGDPTPARRNLAATLNTRGAARRRPPEPLATASRSPLYEIVGGSGAVPTLPPNADRAAILWRARRPIVLVTVAVALAVFGVSHVVTPTYSSSETVQIIASQTPGGSPSDVASASNTLAAQDAQIVKSDAVLAPAAASLHVSTSELSEHISAGTVASQNLVQITAQSSDADEAKAWPGAVATSLKAVIQANAASQVATVEDNGRRQLAAVQAQISTLVATTRAEADPPPAEGSAAYLQYEANLNTLTGLYESRGTVDADLALETSAAEPQIVPLSTATAPTELSPKPSLYTGIAAAAAFLIACQIAISVARRRIREA